ncbi:MAG: hypothetical protein ACFCBW_06705 [Candidatus Competibacterales bacterium]
MAELVLRFSIQDDLSSMTLKEGFVEHEGKPTKSISESDFSSPPVPADKMGTIHCSNELTIMLTQKNPNCVYVWRGNQWVEICYG